MHIRSTIGIAILTAALSTSVIAQSDPIAARKALMKGNNEGAIVAVRMMRGQAPFDGAKVDAIFAQWADTAQKLPGLFPDNSKTGGDTRASPKVWQNKADFAAKSAAFGKAVEEQRAAGKGSVEGLKTAVSVVGKTCDNCHADYRLSQR